LQNLTLSKINFKTISTNYQIMKQIYSLLLLLFTVAFGQAPANYYTTATGTGYTLKRNFYNISKVTQLVTGPFTLLTKPLISINFFEKDGTVLDMYSENPAGVDPYTYAITATQRCGNYVC
jgi:hypothetical protein